MFLIRNRFAALLLLLAGGAVTANCAAPMAYKWSVQYLIDNSQSVFGRSQEVYPRANRALGISPDGNYLYAGYHQSFNNGPALTSKNSRMTNSGEVRKIDLRIADYEDATKAVLPFHQTKAITVDDQNNVYLADGRAIDVYDADLNKNWLTIPMEDCNGVTMVREGSETILYATERERGDLCRFLIDTRPGSDGAKAAPAGLGGNGVVHIQGAQSLRGVAVDARGRIWMADPEVNKVFRINADGSNQVSVDVKNPMAIGFYGDTALITRGTDREIALISPDMVVTGNLSVPWEELELAPYGNNHDGALSGIAVIPGGKGFFVTNEHGQTSNQKSTYGRTDQYSEVIDGKLYTDAFQDDNEPILRAVPVEVQDAAAPTPVASPSP